MPPKQPTGPHFARENEIALPPLGLLARLAAEETAAGLQEALAMSDAVLRDESFRHR